MSASTNIVDIAERNLNERFVQNPCRGIVLGLGEREGAVQLSWIMGRSPNSQNRVYVANGHHILKTEPANSSKVDLFKTFPVGLEGVLIIKALVFLVTDFFIKSGFKTLPSSSKKRIFPPLSSLTLIHTFV